MAGRIASPHLIGREQELGALVSAFDRVSETEVASLVLVSGEAGVGKSRLVGDFIDHLGDRNARVLVGHCIEVSQGDLPFAPIVEAFREALYRLNEDERERVLGSSGHELVRLLPDLVPDVPRPAEDPDGTFGQGRFFELLAGVLQRLERDAPAVLVIEDLHWADSSTRDLLGYLARSFRGTPLLLIATYRSDELHRRHPLRPFVAELGRLPRVETLELTRLSRQDVVDQTVGIIGEAPPAEVIDRIFDLSEGNPFFVEELIAARSFGTDTSLPHSVREALVLRLDTVSEPVQEVLRVAAVAGRDIHHRLLEEVVELDGTSLHQALREAVERYLLVADGDAYRFRHALLREAVYEDLLPGERVSLHRVFADVLERAPELARGGASAAAELSYHHHEARDLPAALKSSLEAGRAAELAYGLGEAHRHYERVLELWQQVPSPEQLAGVDEIEVLRLAAKAAYLHGQLDRAISLIRRAMEVIDADADPVRAGVVHERLGRYLWVLGRTDEAHDAYRRAVEIMPADPPSAERARVLAGEAQILMLDARFSEAMTYAEAAIDMARDVGAKDVLGHALNTLGVSVAYMGDVDRGIDHLLEARTIGQEVSSYDDIGRAYTNLCEVYVLARRFEEAIDAYREAIEFDRRIGFEHTYGVWHHADLAMVLISLGRWEEAEDELAGVVHLPFDQVAGAIDISKARLAMWRGQASVAGDLVRAAHRHLAYVAQPQGVGPLFVTDAELALWTRRPRDAREIVREGIEKLAGVEERGYVVALCWLGIWAEADIATEARAKRDESTVTEAVTTADQLAASAASESKDGPPLGPPTGTWATGALPTIDAEMERLRGASDPTSWKSVADRWDDLGDPFRAAHCRWRAAEASLIAGDRTGATSSLRAALETAKHLRASVLVDELTALATRGRIALEEDVSTIGEGQEPLAPETQMGLTARELEVLKLVAEGLTNPQIAETLFISQKTVSVHVSHILEKFGVSSRVEAASLAHRLGLTGSSPSPHR